MREMHTISQNITKLLSLSYLLNNSRVGTNLLQVKSRNRERPLGEPRREPSDRGNKNRKGKRKKKEETNEAKNRR